jgi:hypothetical protein
LNYTACEQYVEGVAANEPKKRCSEVVAQNWNQTCICHMNFTLEEDFRRDVYIYYGLTNFYQNHRRYVKSRDDRQLLGEIKGSTECAPFDKSGNKWYAPCGAIANSIFNDTFKIQRYFDKTTPKTIPMTDLGIAWATDKNAKFRNPKIPDGQTNLSYAFADTIHPPNWQRNVWELKPSEPNNNGYLNERFIVWMRTAALPTFRKLYARVSHDKNENEISYHSSLPKGNYLLVVQYRQFSKPFIPLMHSLLI